MYMHKRNKIKSVHIAFFIDCIVKIPVNLCPTDIKPFSSPILVQSVFQYKFIIPVDDGIIVSITNFN